MQSGHALRAMRYIWEAIATTAQAEHTAGCKMAGRM
jgi:hypothetical protein